MQLCVSQEALVQHKGQQLLIKSEFQEDYEINKFSLKSYERLALKLHVYVPLQNVKKKIQRDHVQ